MNTSKHDTTELFQSILQPLRQAKQTQSGLSAIDLELECDRRAIVTPKARFPQKSKQGTNDWLMKNYEELERVEEKNLEMVAGVWMIFSQKGFQQLFNPVERILLQKACQFIQFYIKTHNLIMQDMGKGSERAVDKIEALYKTEYLKLQKQLIMFYPELFALAQIFKTSRINKKIEKYFKEESQSMGKMKPVDGVVFDPRGFILGGREGDIVTMTAQQVNRRALLLRVVIEHMSEGSEGEKKVKRIYEQAEDLNLLANEMMRKTDKFTININRDPFCLRELLSEDETYETIAEIAKGKNREIRRGLRFLRDLSVLVKNGSFSNDNFEGKGAVIAFALTYMRSREIKACIKSDNYEALMEALMSKAKEALKQVEPVIREFVISDYFTKRANLLPMVKETEEDYQARLEKRISNGGECIDLFRIEKEERKKWQATRPRNQANSEVPISSPKKKGSSILRVMGLIVPFLILPAIPFVGPIIPLIGFIVLGIAGLAQWMAPEVDKQNPKKEEVISHDRSALANDAVNAPKEKTREKQQSNITIGKRRNTENAKEGPVAACPVMDGNSERLPVKVSACLGGGRWLVEDRKRREKLAANDDLGMKNPISASESELSRSGWFSDSYDSDAGYRSFPEIDDAGDEGEEDRSVGEYGIAL